MNIEELPGYLQINLGTSPAEKLQTVQQIKDAMTVAIINQVENETTGGTDCSIYQTLWYEANYLEKQLQEN